MTNTETWNKGTFRKKQDANQQGDQGQKNQPQPGQGQPQPGKPGNEKSDSRDKDRDTVTRTKKDIDDILSKRKGQGSDREGGVDNGDGEINTSSTKDTPDMGLRDIGKIPKPTYSWESILEQFAETEKNFDPSWSKINKRAGASVAAAAELGAGALKPGEKATENAVKLAFILDSSGSMISKIKTTMSNVKNLLESLNDGVAGIVSVVLTGGEPRYFALDLDNNRFWPTTNFEGAEKPVPSTGTYPLSQFFSIGSNGYNELPDEVTSAATSVLSKEYNVILVTDSDVAGHNLDNLKRLAKNASSGSGRFFTLLADKRSYEYVIKQLGVKYDWISHFPDESKTQW